VSFGQLYRDRGDSENIFDELKNQWAGAASSRRPCSLPTGRAHDRVVYDWWSIFVRLVEPDRHMEPSQPAMLLHAIATRVRHARQTRSRSEFTREGASAAKAFRAVAIFLRGLAKNAEQLTACNAGGESSREPSKFSFRPSVALAATPRTRLTQQLLVEKSQKSAARQTPTAGFRFSQNPAASANRNRQTLRSAKGFELLRDVGVDVVQCCKARGMFMGPGSANAFWRNAEMTSTLS